MQFYRRLKLNWCFSWLVFFRMNIHMVGWHTLKHLPYADGVVHEALGEEEDGIWRQRVILPQLERQQVCGHVLELPGPTRAHTHIHTLYLNLCASILAGSHAEKNLQIFVFQAVQKVVDQLLVLPVVKATGVSGFSSTELRHTNARRLSNPHRAVTTFRILWRCRPSFSSSTVGRTSGPGMGFLDCAIRLATSTHPSLTCKWEVRHAVDEDSWPGEELEELGEEAHGQEDPDGVMLAEDPVGHVVQQPPDGGLFQGHGGRQATAD